LLSILLGLLGTACGQPSSDTASAPASETVRAPLAQVERVVLPATVELSGSVEAERTTAVSSRVVALVTGVYADLGDLVRAGQPLLSIDPTAAEGQVAQAEGALAQAQAASTLAERNLARFEALAKSAAASELELDAARMQRDQAQGAVDQAKGAVAAARSVAKESRVVAPYAGRVAARSVEVGDLATPGRPLMTIESATGRRLRIAVPESLAAAATLKPGTPIAVALDARADPGRFEGTIVEIAPGPDSATHTVTAKIDLGALEVGAGAAGRAWIPAGERAQVLVPARALVESGGLTLVVVREADGRAASRVVTVGERRSDGKVEILSGLAGGESVALGLSSAPHAGSRIEASEGGAQ
jgi:RND family efflux transporter MFP subunit